MTKAADRVRRSALREAVLRWRHRGIRSEDVFVASYPRSGNTWTKFMLAELLAGSEVDFRSDKKVVPMIGSHMEAPRLLPSGGRVIKTHEPYRPVYKQAIYLIRDVRDVASSYFELRRVEGFDDTEFGDFLSRFVAGEVGGFGSWQDHVDSWLDASEDGTVELLVVRFEDLRAATVKQLGRMAQFLGIEAEPKTLEAVVANNTTEKMRARPSTESGDRMKVAVGRGQSGGWRERLSPKDLATLSPTTPTMMRVGYDVT